MREYSVTIDSRFRGPPESANGGYVCGLLARFISGPAEVTLRSPPPLDRELRIRVEDPGVAMYDGDQLVAEGHAAELDIDVPPPISIEHAEQAARRYRGFEHHVFPTCFVCGPERGAGDGLRIFAGRVAPGGAVAAPWTPSESLAGPDAAVREEFVWAALDCPGAFAIEPKGTVQVLGRMTGSLVRPVQPRERYVVTAWSLGGEGRKHFAGSAVFGENGKLHAIAKATWIEIV